MGTVNLIEYLNNNSYPGRGIIIGCTEDRIHAVVAYFIMGRSQNSRNRIFAETEDGIKTQAYDESLLSDPSLIIYSPVRVFENCTIVTNGDQTDTIYDYLKKGKSFELALRSRSFEPDQPNYTPRISGLVRLKNGDFSYKLSILKSADGNPECCERFFYEYDNPISGEGRFIHTYKHDGNPIPSFEGEPKKILINKDINEFGNSIWNALDNDNKVSLFVRYICLKNGQTKNIIYNKNS